MFAIFLLFTAMFVAGWRVKRHLLTGGNLVLFIYAFSAACGLAVYSYYPPTASLESVLYLMTGVTLCIWPLIRWDVLEAPVISGPRERSLLDLVTVVAVVLGVLAFVSYIGNAVKALRIGVGEVRNELFEGTFMNEGGVLTWGVMGNISMLAGGAWMLLLVLACLSALREGRSLRTLVLFATSVCGIPYGISVGGRSPIIYYSLILTFLVVMFFGRGQAVKRNRLAIIAGLLGFLACVFVYSYYVADNRNLVTAHIYSAVPAKTREGATLFTMLDYAGQGIVNFHTYWAIRWTDERIYYGGMNFPLFAGLLKRMDVIGDYNNQEVNDDMMARYEYEGGFGATFSTFLRELIMDFGEVPTLLLCALVGGLLYLCLRRYNRVRDLGSLILIVCLSSIPLLGVFYSYFPSMFGTGTFFVPLSAGLALRFLGGPRGVEGTKEEATRPVAERQGQPA